MSATAIRIRKEARALFWPWCAVMVAGALPLLGEIPHLDVGLISGVGFVFGIQMLACLSFGNEFECRTVSLLLSQPAGRMEVWREKLTVTTAAVVSAAVVFGLGWRSLLVPGLVQSLAGLLAVTTLASGTFWTLSTRSTLGGITLNHFSLSFVSFVFLITTGHNPWKGELPAEAMRSLCIVAFSYAGLMLWLGRRKLARFQVTGGRSGDDLLIADRKVMPEALAGWFRCRPDQPSFNLIRKELRLQRPLWLMALLIVLYVTCLAVFRLVPDPAQPEAGLGWSNFVEVAFVLPLMSPFMALLAGCLALGEERTSGTHSWHMTLPVSARRQWLLKLLVAGFTSFTCALLVPVLMYLILGRIFPLPQRLLEAPGALVWWGFVPLVGLIASFWCGCAVNGTVRAAIWVFPVTILINIAAVGGAQLGQELAKVTGTLRDFVVSWLQLSPLAFASMQFRGEAWPWLFAPVLLVAVIQSYRLFRTDPQDSVPWMIRCLLPSASLACLCGFLLSAGWVATWQPLPETQQAIQKLRADGGSMAYLTVQDLAKVSPLSERTRRWLRSSSISIAPDPARSGYFATIHLASGVDCKITVSHHAGRSFNPEQPSCATKGP